MSYIRLPFNQYFIDTSRGQGGTTPSIHFNYDKISYKHGRHTHNAYYKVLFNEPRDVYQIYFKETTDDSGWRANFEFASEYYDAFQFEGKDIQLKCASGWGGMYCALKHYIREQLSDLIKTYGLKEVEIIGWSLGSALAQLCAQDLFFNYNIKSHLFTFGSVKVWFGKDKDMKEYLSKCCVECYNFGDHNDIVFYMVPFCKYFHMNKVVLKQDKFCLVNLFKPRKYHCEYWKPDYYLEIK